MKWEYLIRITYSDGKYTVEYSYILHPPLEYDSTTSHLNLKFGGEAIPVQPNYQNHHSGKCGTGLCIPPVLWGSGNDGDTYTITGSVAADEKCGS